MIFNIVSSATNFVMIIIKKIN